MTDPIHSLLAEMADEIEGNRRCLMGDSSLVHPLAERARAALAAAPPAPDPHEALAARPLLEAVARMGDRIGQHTVSEITVISDRAAAWLAENQPGQPVAIEPRGCPAPGACSCVEAPAPADPSDFQTLQGIALDMVESLRPIVLPEILGVLRRAIKQAPAPAPAADGERDHVPGAGNMVPAAYAARLRRCPTHGQLPANAWACPECLRELREGLARLRGSAVDGEREEREELATFLTKEAVAMDCWFERDTAKKVRRAAALLRQPAPVPVPVADRPWEQPGWCDAEGRCWLRGKVEGDWRLMYPLNSGVPQLRYAFDFSLPHWAIPQPPQSGEVAE
jgi:hypothetical protein